MQQVLQGVLVLCWFGFGWALGSARLFQDREMGCAPVAAALALAIGVAGIAWGIANNSSAWLAWAWALAALVGGAVLAAVRKRYH